MPDPVPSQNSLSATLSQPSPLQCVTGSLVAGALAFALYRLTRAIVQTFAESPLQSHNPTAVNISVAVRTLVTGMSTLATAVFGFAALGLMALTIQILWQRLFKRDDN